MKAGGPDSVSSGTAPSPSPLRVIALRDRYSACARALAVLVGDLKSSVWPSALQLMGVLCWDRLALPVRRGRDACRLLGAVADGCDVGCGPSKAMRTRAVASAATASSPAPAAAPIAAVAKTAAAVVIPSIIWPERTVRRNTIPPPINPMPVTAPAMAFGEPAPARLPRRRKRCRSGRRSGRPPETPEAHARILARRSARRPRAREPGESWCSRCVPRTS
jgi:hypothetical protein